MEDIKIITLSQRHLAQVEKWPSRHSAANTLFKKPAEPSAHQPDSYGWAVVRGEEVLAIATVKLNKEHVGYLSCIVKPSERHGGIGTKLIKYVLEQKTVDDLVHLHAVIDFDNTAARQVLREQGFTRIGDKEGYLEYARHKHY